MLLVVGTLCALLWTEDCSFLNLQSTCNPRIAVLNSNFEMHSVRVRNVEVYKAQRQLRPIQLKISLVAIQDFTQVKNIRNFAQF